MFYCVLLAGILKGRVFLRFIVLCLRCFLMIDCLLRCFFLAFHSHFGGIREVVFLLFFASVGFGCFPLVVVLEGLQGES